MSESESDDTTVEQLKERIAELESHVYPNRRDVMAAAVGAVGISALTGTASAAPNYGNATGSAGTDSKPLNEVISKQVTAQTVSTDTGTVTDEEQGLLIGDGSTAPRLFAGRDTTRADLTVQPSGGDQAGSVDIFPSGTEGRSHVLLAVDNDPDNFGFLELEANGTEAWLNTNTKGTATALSDFRFQNSLSYYFEGTLDIENQLKTVPETRTISSGQINYARAHIQVEGEGGSADTLTDIGAGEDGDILILKRGGEDITVEHGTGNIRLDGGTNFTMQTTADRLLLQYEPTVPAWVEISRASQ